MHNIRLILFYVLASFSITSANGNTLLIPALDYKGWNTIHQDNIWVGWVDYKGLQICQSKGTFNFALEEIADIIENKTAYPDVFKRISKVHIFEDDIIHIILDMPFPFSNRDYVVKYIESGQDGEKIYRFFSVTEPAVEIEKNVVRLINASGEWRLAAKSANTTEVSYIWNGELLGSFPDWALTDAWETQGVEVLNWLEEALNEKSK